MSPHAKKSRHGFEWAKYDRYLILILFIVISTLLSDKFLTSKNITNLLNQNSASGIVAIGELLVIITGGIDLSVGAIASMCAVIVALLLKNGLHWLLASFLAMLVGLVAGLINGVLVTRLRLPAFVVTLATMNIFQGVALLLSKGREVFYKNNFYVSIGKTNISIIPIVTLLWLTLAFLTNLFLKKTVTGRYIHGIGGNRYAVRLSGVKVPFYESLVYAASGLLSAIGGILMASRLTLGSNSVGYGWELIAIAAVMVGGGSSVGGIGTAGGAVVGAIIMGLIGNIMNLTGITIYWQQIIRGLIIIIAVFTSQLRVQRRSD